MPMLDPLVLPQKVFVIRKIALRWPVVHYVVVDLGISLDDIDIEIFANFYGLLISPQFVDGKGLAG